MDTGEGRFIAPQGSGAYGTAMLAAMTRMVAFLALLAMPLGMAVPAGAKGTPASASEHGHCSEDQGEPEAPAKSSAHCTACAALPAVSLSAVESLLPSAPRTGAVVTPFDGIELEIATPPPKSA